MNRDSIRKNLRSRVGGNVRNLAPNLEAKWPVECRHRSLGSMQKPQQQPTGCFKCGRPGHWSKDCPSTLPSTAASASAAASAPQSGAFKSKRPAAPVASAAPRKRPNLTPDLLLSNDGLGYVLEHFPRLVPIRGRGHEMDDLTKLLEAYMSWHARLLPYFSFDQFVDKVEKLGATRRVRLCVRELRDKIERGEEPQISKDCQGTAGEQSQALAENPAKAAADLATEEVPYPEDEEVPFPVDIDDEMFDEIFRQTAQDAP